MKPQQLAWVVQIGMVAVATILFLAATMFVLQFLLWLKFDQWLDWSTIYALATRGGTGQSGAWRGFHNIFDWISTAPVEIGSWIAAVILLLIFTAVRIFARR